MVTSLLVFRGALMYLGSLGGRDRVYLILYRAHLCMKYTLGISNFLEKISNFSHSIIFLYYFAFTTEEGLND